MPVDLSRTLVIGVTSSALFDMTEADKVYQEEGLQAYIDYQHEHAENPLPLGTGFSLVKAVLHLNTLAANNKRATRTADVVVASKNAPATCERLYNSIEHHGLHGIERSFLVGGADVAPYLGAFNVDLFLSTSHIDVEQAIRAGIPAALTYAAPDSPTDEIDQIRIAFDGDAVLFSEESEIVYKSEGLEGFIEHEKANVDVPLPQGPFYKLLKVLSFLQNNEQFKDRPPVRIALVTARSMPTHERVIKTLKRWNVRVDEAFFMGGVAKTKVLSAFKPHIFFDDQDTHCKPASFEVPTARVPSQLDTTPRLFDKNAVEDVDDSRGDGKQSA